MSGIEQDTQHPSASLLDQAETRLAQALGRLEAALEAREQTWSQSAAAVAPDPGQNQDLNDEIARLKTENGELRALVGEAYDRVDGVIGKLKAQMDRVEG